jgi:hypothetical protein
MFSPFGVFNPRIYHVLFLLSKNGLYVWISPYPLVENSFFLNVPLLLWVWDFVDMHLTQLGTRLWTPAIHIDSKNWFFRPPKLCCPPSAQWEKTFKSTLNVMISQMVRSECVRFGGHVGKEVSYKILWLEVLKESPILDTSPCSQ